MRRQKVVVGDKEKEALVKNYFELLTFLKLSNIIIHQEHERKYLPNDRGSSWF